MTVGCSAPYDFYQLSDLDDLDCSFSLSPDTETEAESGLCVPWDSLDSLGWLPDFPNDPISFRDLDLSDGEFFSIQKHDTNPPVSATRKQRSKRPSKQRAWTGSWPSKGIQLAAVHDGDGEEAKRRCSHCQTNKTPQWRMGPLGPKTLCNACGVRYKSGRLVPEYRPAASPTFDCFKHSNFHKRIMRIRGGDEGEL